MHALSSQDDLEILMARYQAGDFAAARALIDRVSGQLHRFFMAQFASRADADDLLQETWLRIHRVRHTYRAGEPVLPWFYAIARNVRVDHYRKAARARRHEQKYQEMLNAKVVVAEAPGEIDSLESLLAGLPDGQREAIEMLKVAGMSVEEVARAMSTTVGSVKQRVHRAYKTLRKKLQKMGVRKSAGGATL